MTAPPPVAAPFLDQMLPPEATGIDAIRAMAPPSFSEERDTVQPTDQPEESGVDMQQDLGMPPQGPSPEMQNALITLYGPDFPMLNANARPEDWVQWTQNTWDRLGPGVQRRLYLVQRNRLFRQGIQWISSSGFGPWREPPRARDAVRIVENLIAPALNQRQQIVSEQRPGFNVRPATSDPADRKRAEAKQLALEYQYDQQNMSEIIREASYWAGTDGVSFLEMYWDPDAGPWHESYPEQGPGVAAPPMPSPGGAPLPPAGAVAPSAPVSTPGGTPPSPTPGPPGMPPPQPGGPAQYGPPPGPMGDVKTRVRRVEQVRVSSNSSATQKPWFWVVRDVMSKAEAIRMYGLEVASEMEGTGSDTTENLFNNYPTLRMGYQLPNIDELLMEQEKINRWTLYCEKSLGLPKGLTIVVVGQKVIFMGPLLFGTAPVVRWADGTTDPSFFPQAEMELWVDSQMRINTIKSKWAENIRLNSGPKMIAKENAISTETYTAGNMSIISAKGLGGLNEIVKPLDAFSVGADAKEALALERKQFEDLSGWNDTTRGSFSADQSGRAILAIREQVERIFAPLVNAAAKAMTEWAKKTCAIMAWGYDFPRTLGVEGKGRPDLASALKGDDFDGVADVWIDPETLMPMPRALRLFLLKDMFQQGLMGAQEYRRRLPFAWTKSLNSPDEDQEARAKRCAEALRQGQSLPLLWQDNESIHQDVLERELILPDDTNPQIRQMAIQRWMQLGQQMMVKQGAGPGQMPQQGGKPGKGNQPSPTDQPLAGTTPGVAAQSPGLSDQDRAASQFESQQKQIGQ